MSGLIDRIQDRTATPDERLRVLPVDGDESDEVLDALASDTRRTLLRELFAEPGTPSEVADRADTSVQNVHYHLSSLEAAGLVEPIDTRYSEKGHEMTVYGPASDPIVFVGDRDLRPRVERSLSEVVAGLGVLAVASLLVQWGAERLVGAGARDAAVEPASYGPTAPPGSLGWLVFDVVEPGVLFFFGCLLVLAVVAYATE